MSPTLNLSEDMRKVLDALCDNNGSLSGDDLKRMLGWDDSYLTLIIQNMLSLDSHGKMRDDRKILINASLTRAGGTTREYVGRVILANDGQRYCNKGKPSSI